MPDAPPAAAPHAEASGEGRPGTPTSGAEHPATLNVGADRPVTRAAALTALGIVYGDLGTSPLYTVQTILGAVGGTVDAAGALGVLSLVFWALLITVSLKYCVFVMRADNHGEGGILALMSLVGARPEGWGRLTVGMGLFGAALIYGDGIITPAISVLSALEGVNVATDWLQPYVMPTAVVVLVALFGCQTFGTATIGRAFGPVMLLWFGVLALLGVGGILQHPVVLEAVDPRHALGFLASRGWGGFAVLGGVFLAITGGEALYADMGHIGRGAVRLAWYGLVLPALLLNYAGQTALLIAEPDATGNPFFRLAPGWAVIPLVGLATAATIIASQAIITGAFSLTRQAMQLGWFPGLLIRQTSAEEYGQIYVPFVNWVMMGFTLLLTVSFGSSAALAGAYGTAVSTTMLLTTALLYQAMRGKWGWSPWLASLVCGGFLLVDLAFFGANLMKIREGGWIPLLFGAAIFALMTTWWRGQRAMRDRLVAVTGDPAALLGSLREGQVPRVPGTAVFLGRTAGSVAPAVLRHAAVMGVLPETTISMTVRFEEVPRVPMEERVAVEDLGQGLWHVTVRFGFVEVPNLRETLARAWEKGCPVDLDNAVYFASREAVARSSTRPRLAGWQRLLFGFMYRNAVHTADRFDLPAGKLLEVGRQIEV